MLDHARRSVVFALIALVVFGILYPLAGTGLSQLLFKNQADGSLTVNGSSLIGQNWWGPRWFHGRPDDTGPYAAVICGSGAKNCTPAAGGDNPLMANGSPGESAATNLGPRSKALVSDTEALVAYWHKLGVADPTPDLVTTSGSGLDPDITPDDAYVQVPTVAQARGLSPSAVRALVTREIHRAQFGFLGSDYIDVLQLNEALAALH